jgi:uncharacterized protein (DUF1800 family)
MSDFTRTDVAHLLRRCGFLAKPAEVDALMGLDSWSTVVDHALSTTGNPAETIPADIADPSTSLQKAVLSGHRYWLTRMATTPTPIVEKVAFFWHGILTSAVPNPDMLPVFKQIQTWRRLGLGDLHALMQAMAIDPAMLDYLDNAANVKAAPNENFARELMELFTMGNGTFTEDDVIAMARAWTGHNLQYPNQTYLFKAAQHDTGQKTLFGITKNWDGPDAITEIIRGSKQPVSARYLAGRIWSAFAAPNPSVPLLDELTASLIAAEMNVKTFLKVVFLRPEFRMASTRIGLVRSPIEWDVAILRATGLPVDELGLEKYQIRLGQVLYRPPNVSGWRQNRAWISSSALWAKGLVSASLRVKLQSAGTFAGWNALSVSEAVSAAFARFGIDDPSAATRTHLEAYLTGERSAGRSSTASAGLGALMTLTPDFQLS